MIYPVDLTGDYWTEIYGAARQLLADGADPEDEVVTARNGRESMRGQVGRCAKYKVRERKSGKPTLSLERWRPCDFGQKGAAEEAEEEGSTDSCAS